METPPGCLSCEAFEREAKAVATMSSRSAQVWEWVSIPKGNPSSCSCSGWLSLRGWRVPPRVSDHSTPQRAAPALTGVDGTPNSEQHTSKEEEDDDDELSIDIEDECALPARDVTGEDPAFEYNVVHNPTYMVPVLYLRGQAASGDLLRPEQVWEHCCSASAIQKGDASHNVPLPTPDEHPVTGEPFLFLHPCQTQTCMAQLGFTAEVRLRGEQGTSLNESSEGASAFAYLLMWLSIFGGAVGLRLDPSLHARSRR